jgi:hypothetical protein
MIYVYTILLVLGVFFGESLLIMIASYGIGKAFDILTFSYLQSMVVTFALTVLVVLFKSLNRKLPEDKK